MRNVTHFQAEKFSRKICQSCWRSCVLLGGTEHNQQTTYIFELSEGSPFCCTESLYEKTYFSRSAKFSLFIFSPKIVTFLTKLWLEIKFPNVKTISTDSTQIG